MLWHRDECASLPCFNAKPDIFAVLNCCIVALSVFSSDIVTWSADSLYSVQWHIRRVRMEEYAYIWCQQTLPKRWFANMNITSNCDVTNSPYQIQIPPYATEWNPPMKIFCVRHCYGNSLSCRGSNTQPSNWEADTSPLGHCRPYP